MNRDSSPTRSQASRQQAYLGSVQCDFGDLRGRGLESPGYRSTMTPSEYRRGKVAGVGWATMDPSTGTGRFLGYTSEFHKDQSFTAQKTVGEV